MYVDNDNQFKLLNHESIEYRTLQITSTSSIKSQLPLISSKKQQRLHYI